MAPSKSQENPPRPLHSEDHPPPLPHPHPHPHASSGGLLFDRISHSLKDKARNRRKGEESSTNLHYCDIVDSSCFNAIAPDADECLCGHSHSHDTGDRHDTFVPQNAEHYVVRSHPIAEE